jgi:hypothetical protein
MPCYHPLTAYQAATGDVVFYESRRHDIVRTLTLPCGQCIGCRLERSRQWAIRCLHEASLYKQNCFITLTYSDEYLPSNMSLDYRDFQLFMKRLRKKFGTKIRFYMAGEYGENFGRPHFHACLFNLDFQDKVLWKRTSVGSRIFRSGDLEELWPYGFSSIGEVTFESAAYVARYIMKKVTGKQAGEHYEYVCEKTGEITNRTPEFNHMSLKPGIGAKWLEKYHTDVYPNDYVVIRGKKVKPPKYYDKKWAKEYPIEFDMIQFERESKAKENYLENFDDRLKVREQVAAARLSFLKRQLT